jgi:hypothetical protein
VQKEGEENRAPQAENATREIVLFHESSVMRIAPMIAMSPSGIRGHVPAALVTRSEEPPVPPPRHGA